MRTLGWGGGLPEGFKEGTSSFTASFSVPGEWIQVPAALVEGLGWSDQQMLGEQLPTHGKHEKQPGNAPTLALPDPTLRKQTRWATRSPPVGSWP